MAIKITEVEVAIIQKVEIRNCDDCNVEITEKHYINRQKCTICGKDLCKNCVAHCDGWGDYPNHWCKDCWEIGIPIKAEQYELQEKIDELDDKWDKLGKQKWKDKQNGL